MYILMNLIKKKKIKLNVHSENETELYDVMMKRISLVRNCQEIMMIL